MATQLRRRTLPDLQHDSVPLVQSKVMSKVPFVLTISATMNSGKSHLALGIVHKMLAERTLNKVYLISPTADSNAAYRNVFSEERGDMLFTDLSAKIYNSLQTIQDDIAACAAKWYEQVAFMAALRKYRQTGHIDVYGEHLVELYGTREINIDRLRPKPVIIIGKCK